jgi:hypothetical protein
MVGLLLGLAVLGGQAAAAADSKVGVAYRWVDEHGVVHYGDSVPPQYSEKERTIFNSRGVAVGHISAQKSAEQQAADDREEQEINKQRQHDSFLIATYTSVKDIERLRDVRLDQMKGQRVAAEQYVETLRSRLASLQSRAMLFRPYNARGDAHRMPDDLAEDLVRTVNELRIQSTALTAKSDEESTLRSQFNADIERYQLLRAAHAQR